MTVADYIIKFLTDKGVSTVFMLTGGQAMYLNDAVYRNKKIHPVYTHHEQAAAMAAEAYGRTTGKIGVAMVTAGPAALNILNGVVGAYVDSSPMMVITGQSNSSTVEYMESHKIRQYGIQGINIAPYAIPSTKYFVRVDNPSNIKYYLEKAYYEAVSGRTGPVWLDVPLDIQRMEVKLDSLLDFIPPKKTSISVKQKNQVKNVVSLLLSAKRPLMIAGQGIKISGADKEFEKFIKQFNFPVATTRLGIDLIDSSNPLFAGRPGLYGDRYANIAIQNADLIIAVGARLDMGHIGYDPKDWGRNANKVLIDIDKSELAKPGIAFKSKIQIDAKIFFQEILSQTKNKKINVLDWIKLCQKIKKKYPTVLPEYSNESKVNTYYFSKVLSDIATNTDQILLDTSSCFHVVTQSWNIKNGQRFLTTGGLSTMGYWPAGIGMALAYPKKRTFVITGDGSFSMNIQELATIKQVNLPIKIFVFNNNGYLLIRHTQNTHMEGRLMGESPKTGLWLPNITKIAKAYEIKAVHIKSTHELTEKLDAVLKYNGPVICDISTPVWQKIIPRISSSKGPDGKLISRPFEDLYPFLPQDELNKHLITNNEKK